MLRTQGMVVFRACFQLNGGDLKAGRRCGPALLSAVNKFRHGVEKTAGEDRAKGWVRPWCLGSEALRQGMRPVLPRRVTRAPRRREHLWTRKGGAGGE